ncbi:exopolyphosphatase [Flavobacterium sp.]|uniref:Ppx/GppA phosphatase family protein n=1 Tax=Flavobacterium sp. TaxID=239 RepID=UPI003D12FE34
MLQKIFLTVLLMLLTPCFLNAQGLYAGIEVGSKGIKISVIDVQNIKKSVYTVKDFWTENVGIARSISIDGNLGKEEIEKASNVVWKNYQKLRDEFKVDDSRIFIVGSSGVAMAKNTQVLADKIKETTHKNIEFINSKLEAKLLLKGGIPPKYFTNSLILDIGGGNTKGGYVEEFTEENIVFYPLNLDYGTITLTEAINKKTNTGAKYSEYVEANFKHLTTLREGVIKMYNEHPNAHNKTNVYFSGGAVWAFYTLYFEMGAKDNFNAFTYDDLVNYNFILQNNFKKFEQLALTNPEVDKVIKTYSQKHLIAANSILLTSLEELKSFKSKKLFFVKQGQIAWLLAYVADSAKGARVIF